VRASMMLPITVGEQIWGLLMVQQCVASRTWQPWEVDFLTQLATQLAIAIQQSELFQQVQQFNTVLEGQIQEHINQLQQALTYEALLKRITDSVRDSLDENQIFQTAVRELAIGLQLNGCSSALYDTKRQNLTITHEHLCYDLPPRVGHQIPLASEPNLYSQVRQGKCLQFCPLSEFSSSVQAVQAKYTILACPISVAIESVAVDAKQDHLEIIGDLWLFRPRDRCFSEMEIRLVQQVSNQCAIALRQSRLYQAARAQVVELERLNQLKDDFLSTVSHELRTPMSNIKMATQMLEVTLFSQPNNGMNASQAGSVSHPDLVSWQKVSRYFQILKDEGEREIKLINNLLDLSRLDSGREPLFLSTMHLKVWVPYLAEPFIERTKAQQQTLLISIDPDLPPLTTDFSYLERILSELLHNACKYTPSGETLTVLARTVTAVADQPGSRPFAGDRTIELSVTNSGVEIPAIECDRVFDKFYRIPHNDPWKHGGTGLGLALVKKLVERLEGTIWVESANRQTSFVMRFPRSLS
ncbi:MAG TPA: GAF domain-containing sensor histidine kinase, partial [Thermosynechococcaceae cyanobacterium]